MSQRLTRMVVDGEPEQPGCKRLASSQETQLDHLDGPGGLERFFSGSFTLSYSWSRDITVTGCVQERGKGRSP